jgi:hypothetical protein
MHRGVGVSSAFGGSLAKGGGKYASGSGNARADHLQNDTRHFSSHTRRKQDDEILAELERDTAANGASSDKAAHSSDADHHDGLLLLASPSNADAKKKRADSSEQRRGEKVYNTSLPREDAHRFRATVRAHCVGPTHSLSNGASEMAHYSHVAPW